MSKEEKETCHTSLEMNKNLHRDLKIFSFTEDIDMRDVIQESVRAYLTAYAEPAIRERIISAGSFTKAIIDSFKLHSLD